MKRLFSTTRMAGAGCRSGASCAGLVAFAALAACAAGSADAADAQGVAPLRWSTASDYSAGSYRWSLSRGSVDFGLGLDTPSRAGFVDASRPEATGPFVQTLPSLSLGLRSAEASKPGLLTQLAGAETATTYIHRIGIEWKPAESQLMFVREGLGVRLSGDNRLTMRLRHGTLSIYMQRTF